MFWRSDRGSETVAVVFVVVVAATTPSCSICGFKEVFLK